MITLTEQRAIRYADRAVANAPDDADLEVIRRVAIREYWETAINEEEKAEEAFNNGQFGMGA
jgi:hypothetical protein